MASNPQWARSLKEWMTQFNSWLDPAADETTLMPLAVFLDFRPVYGDEQLAELLKAYVFRQELAGVSRFLAQNVVSIPSPFTFLGRIYYGKKGLDIKHLGLLPIVNGIKALMLEAKIIADSTLERMDLLMQREILDPVTGEPLKEAFQFFYMLRLKHQLRQLRFGLMPDDYIKSNELHQLEKANLKECLRTVGNFQGLLKIRYGLVTEFDF